MTPDPAYLANVNARDVSRLAFNIIDVMSKEGSREAQVLSPALVFLALCEVSETNPSVFLEYASRISRRSDSDHLRALTQYLDEQVFKK